MVINYNGQETQVLNKITLQSFLEKNELADKSGIAVAINQQVIPRDAWSSTILSEKDSVLVIKATQGG